MKVIFKIKMFLNVSDSSSDQEEKSNFLYLLVKKKDRTKQHEKK